MKQEDRLKIQAWMDGELAPREAAQAKELAQKDPEARALAEELELVADAIKTGEKQAVLKEPRDFYWSQIQLQIEAEEPMPTPNQDQPTIIGGALLRWLIPVGSLAAITALMVHFNNFQPNPAPEMPKMPSITGKQPNTSSGRAEPSPASMEGENDNPVRVYNPQQFGEETPSSLPESIENPDQ